MDNASQALLLIRRRSVGFKNLHQAAIRKASYEGWLAEPHVLMGVHGLADEKLTLQAFQAHVEKHQRHASRRDYSLVTLLSAG
jgi:hypothetical protein